MIAWKKSGQTLRGEAGPFVVSVAPKGDGRYDWSVIEVGADSPQATGIGSSLGAAKNAAEQYVKRSGRV